MLKIVMSTMTPEMVHRFWSLMSEIGYPELIDQRDDDLIPILLRACQQQHPLSCVDTRDLNRYISARLPLIRDLVLG